MDNPRLEYLAQKARTLPLEPGIYLMKDRSGQIIYVGKAKKLRNRVSSYFRSVEKHLPKVYRMVENVWDFETILTRSEFEALILECSFIKQHSPKYNILLKDDKGYHYIRITPGDWGRIEAVHQKEEDGSRYIGPYLSGYVVNQTVDEVNRAFLLPTCSRRFPQEIGRQRPCLNYHIHQCMAPCTGKISPQEYKEALEQAVDFLKGDSQQAQKLLAQKMYEASEAMEFEKAARYRDRLKAIQAIQQRQKLVSIRYEEEDVIAVVQGLAGSGESCCAVVLQFRGYKLVDKEYFFLEQGQDLAETRSRFLMQYYEMKGQIPKMVVLDGELEHPEEQRAYLCEKAGRKVELVFPQKGDQKQLVELARDNASQQIAQTTRRTNREVAALDELARLLGLPQPPRYIEAYDISNIGSQTIVAGMVVYQDGRPLKGAYRKFSVRSVQGAPDDYASMREVITRRLTEYGLHKEEGVGFGRLPDLILLDGGRTHVAAVKPLVQEMGFSIPVFGMVKDDRHRTRTVTTEEGELSVSAYRGAFRLLTAIQDEVHRFSISYSRSKHQSGAFRLALEGVPGIGPKRAQALFSRFGSLKAMKAAGEEELAAVPGMTAPAARELYRALHKDGSQLPLPPAEEEA